MPRVAAITQYRRHQLFCSIYGVADLADILSEKELRAIDNLYLPTGWLRFDAFRCHFRQASLEQSTLPHKAGAAYRKIERHMRTGWTFQGYDFNEMWPHLDEWFVRERLKVLRRQRAARHQQAQQVREDLERHLRALNQALAEPSLQLQQMLHGVRSPAAPPRQVSPSRQHQIRLSRTAQSELVAKYLRGARQSDLAGAYGIHRTTVAAIIKRLGD